MKPARNQQELSSEPTRCAPKSLNDVHLTVLSLDQHFCVIDKPADVRMDGGFDVTVEKLMERCLEQRDIHIKASELKWIHQLDFATSGVLCVGLTRAGAAAASSCFEHREVEKSYLAVLSGHIDITKWPIFPYESKEEIKCPYKRRKTSNPTVSTKTDPTWQQQVMKENLDILWNALQNIDITTCPLSVELQSQYESAKAISYATYSLHAKHRKQLRKFLKSINIHVKLIESHPSSSVSSADTELERVQSALSEERLNDVIHSYHHHQIPPCIFRIQGDEGKLVIRVPVAQVAGDFR
jgi:hypothetical protein